MVLLDPILRDAVIFASMLSLLSLGMTLTYVTTKVPNFAHGSFATIGMFTALTSTEILGIHAYLSLPLAMAIGGLTSLALYLLALRPMIGRGAGIVVLMIATIAYELVLLALLNIYGDYITQTFKIQARGFFIRKRDITLFGEPGVFLVSPILVALIVFSLYVLLTKTKFGVAMRAAIENPTLAGSIGINVKRVYLFSWFLAGGLGGVAGSMLALWFQGDPSFGSRVLISIFAASILGGFLNIYGAVMGGYMLGLAEILGTRQIALTFGAGLTVYRPLIPLVVMALTLVIAPRGLTGVDWRSLIYRFTFRKREEIGVV